MSILLASIVITMTVSFFCSLAEAALLSLTPSQVAEISRHRPGVGAIWRRFKANIERPIAMILILNTAAHTVGATIAGAQFDKMFGDQWIWVFSLVFTFFMLQYTEILPKTLGVRSNRTIALWIARPLDVGVRLITPLIRMLNLLNRPFESRRGDARQPTTMEEIASLAASARLSEHIGAHQERIITGAARLSETCLGPVMIPMGQVSMLSTSHTLQQALDIGQVDTHTRFPVYEGDDRNKVIGYVNFKELVYSLHFNPAGQSLRDLVRPVHFASPESKVAELLRLFVDQHEHMAIVRDAQGLCVGLITLEDLIEELVGEVHDEFDRLPRHRHSLGGGTWMFGGGLPVAEAAALLGGRLAGIGGTLDAWLEKEIGQSLKPGQVVRYEDVEFTVRRVRRGRVFEASVAIRDGVEGGSV